MSEKHGTERPTPPKSPVTATGLLTEMFGVFDSCPGLYQGMLRYWFMWRLPQIISCVHNAGGLKFQLCGSYQGLLHNFVRLFFLPDFLTIGQCGHVLQYEMLQIERPIDQNWPRTDGTQSGLGIISMKPDRPILDGVVNFAQDWIRPLAPAGNLLWAPFTTLLAPPLPTLSRDTQNALLRDALNNAGEEGLPGQAPIEKWQSRMKNVRNGESVPLVEPASHEEEVQRKYSLANMELAYGRYYMPGSRISQIDPYWSPADIIAFEFLMSERLGAMLVVAGDWADLVPDPSHKLDLTIPYVEGVVPRNLIGAIDEEAEAYAHFRATISEALLEALRLRGSETFSKEMRRIQRDIIDDGVRKLNRHWDQFKKRRWARLGGYTAGTLALSVGLYAAISAAALAGLIGGAAVSVFKELENRIIESAELRDEPMFFIWKLGR